MRIHGPLAMGLMVGSLDTKHLSFPVCDTDLCVDSYTFPNSVFSALSIINKSWFLEGK